MKDEIFGLDVILVTPCRCGCAIVRVWPHSTRSNKPIWKCVWCQKRRGAPTPTELTLLSSWIKNFGYTFDPLIFPDTGGIEVAYSVPKMWERPHQLGCGNAALRTVSPPDTAITGGGRLSGAGQGNLAGGDRAAQIAKGRAAD